MTPPLLSVRNLTIHYPQAATPAVADLSFDLPSGSIVAIVGESGSGKSTTALAVANLGEPSRIAHGTITLNAAPAPPPGRGWGGSVGFVFQNPRGSFSPLSRIGAQLDEIIVARGDRDRHSRRQRIAAALTRANLAPTRQLLRSYPHQLSGGMLQRVAIAAALVAEPSVLIADEPTSALDARSRLRVMTVLRQLAQDEGIGVLWVTHDIDAARIFSDHIVVMRSGRAVEVGPTANVLQHPKADYTRALLAATPTEERGWLHGTESASQPRSTSRTPRGPETYSDVGQFPRGAEVQLRNITVSFPGSRYSPARTAVDNVSLTLRPGERVALIGESGSGKTTLARVLVGLQLPTSGSGHIGDVPLNYQDSTLRAHLRGTTQMVFQDPIGSLDELRTVIDSVEEPAIAQGAARTEARRRAAETLEHLGIATALHHRRPPELSGGQCQRVGLARALITEPAVLVFDEPTSALDTLIQADVLRLITAVTTAQRITTLFISHDIRVAAEIADRVAVMAEGRIVEILDAQTLFTRAAHPFTQELLAATRGDLTPLPTLPDTQPRPRR